jgi:hypothetical protein
MAVSDYPMTYDIDTSIMTIWGNSEDNEYDKMGYSEATAFDFDDIKDYALYLDSSLAKEYGYSFNFAMRFITNDTYGGNTYFIDKGKQIELNRPVGYSWNSPIIKIYADVYWRLGEVKDETLKTSSNGCSIKLPDMFLYGGGIQHNGTGGIYSSYFTTPPYPMASVFTYWANTGDARIWNTKIQGCCIRQLGTNNDIYNLSIEQGGYGLYYTKGDFDKLSITNGTCTARVTRLALSNLVKNLFSRNNTYFLSMYNATDGTYVDITDGDVDEWDTYTGTISSGTTYVYRRYTLNMEIKKGDGYAEGANVLIKNSNNEIIFEGITNENGTITEQVLLVNEWRYTNPEGTIIQTFYDYNPFTIEVSKSNYKLYYSINVLKPVTIYGKMETTDIRVVTFS